MKQAIETGVALCFSYLSLYETVDRYVFSFDPPFAGSLPDAGDN